jgi:hypothetical protein
MTRNLDVTADEQSAPAPADKPKPLGATEVARGLLARLAQSGSHRSGVEITRNAKFDVQWKIDVAIGSQDGIDTIEQAVAKAIEIHESLSRVFPAGGAA